MGENSKRLEGGLEEYRKKLEREKIIDAPAVPKVLKKEKKSEIDLRSLESKSRAIDADKIQEARQELKEKELMEKVLLQAGIFSKTSYPAEINPQERANYQSMVQEKMRSKWSSGIPYQAEQQFGAEFARNVSHLRDKKINEFLDIRHINAPVVEKIVIPGKKGFLGFGSTPDRVENRRTGESRQMSYNELVAGDSQEPAVQFTYLATDSQKNGELYKDFDNRHGKCLQIFFILPESTARELQKTIDSDPTFVRELAERAMKEKVLKNAEDWEKRVQRIDKQTGKPTMLDPVKPPYEQWDASPEGSRFYIQKEGGEPGFHQECVRTIKSKTKK